MKYKVAIVDTDSIYSARFSKTFEKYYEDEMTIVSYANWEFFQDSSDKDSFHLVMVDETTVKTYFISDELPIVFLQDNKNNDINTDGRKTICKYQKHQILKEQIVTACKQYEAQGFYQKKMIYVTSATGGEGVTSVALAIARKNVQSGKKVLYISLGKNSADEIYFGTGTIYYLTDVLTRIRNDQNIEVSALEEMISRDKSGIFYLSAAKNVFEVSEIRLKEIHIFLQKIRAKGTFDLIIVDGVLDFDEFGRDLCNMANQVYVVCKETTSSIFKLKQLCGAFEMWEQLKPGIFHKVSLIYNEYGKKDCKLPDDTRIQVFEKIPSYENEQELKVIEMISEENHFNMDI